MLYRWHVNVAFSGAQLSNLAKALMGMMCVCYYVDSVVA